MGTENCFGRADGTTDDAPLCIPSLHGLFSRYPMQLFSLQWLYEVRAARKSTAAATLTDFDRLALIRFPLILLIVFFHNDRGGDFSAHLHDAPAAAGVIHLLSYWLGGIRVPTFFLIAGYVFFQSATPAASWFGAKFRSRTRTLLVPLVSWNLLGLVSLALLQQLPFTAHLLNAKSGWSVPVAQFTAWQTFEAVFGTPASQPLVYPLWFLRDLFVLVLATPLVYWAIKASGGWVTAAVVALWLLGIRLSFVAEDAFFFFFVGAHLAIARRSIFTFDGAGIVAGLGWLMLQAAEAYGVIGADVHKPKALFGVIAVLYLSGRVAQCASCALVLQKTARYSFFIFVAHEPLLTVTRKAYLALAAPAGAWQWVTAYFVIVFVVIAVLVFVFRAAEMKVPRLLQWMTGGRSIAPDPAEGLRRAGRAS